MVAGLSIVVAGIVEVTKEDELKLVATLEVTFGVTDGAGRTVSTTIVVLADGADAELSGSADLDVPAVCGRLLWLSAPSLVVAIAEVLEALGV